MNLKLKVSSLKVDSEFIKEVYKNHLIGIKLHTKRFLGMFGTNFRREFPGWF